MKALFYLPETFSDQQTENAYLLCLAMLNFEHQVHVVFTAKSWQTINANDLLRKQWLALKLYGAKGFYQLSSSQHSEPSRSHEALTHLTESAFDELKNAMDFLS
ncbi:MAG: hypothetical protein ACSHWU_03360 [Marinicella sp.]